MKPKIFIGCSSESLAYSEAISYALSQCSKPTLWNQSQSVFKLSAGTLESLEKVKDSYDFALLVLTPDDLTESHGKSQQSPRDNVILELGIFIGAIGRSRTFIICDHAEPIKLPSDLDGIMIATFDSSSDDDPSQVVSSAVYQIKNSINTLGVRYPEKLNKLQAYIRITVIGSTSHSIEGDTERTEALKQFYRTFFDELDRTPFGINTCGPEPIRTILYDLYRSRLETHSRSQMLDFEQRIRWYWRKGGSVGLNHEPPVFYGVEAKDQTERREMEISEAAMILAIAGRTGTRDYLEELLAKHNDPSSDFTFDTKPILLLGWFGGEVLKFMGANKQLIQPYTEPYSTLLPFKEILDWNEKGLAQSLARDLILTIRHLYSPHE